MRGEHRAGILLVDKPEGPTSHDIVERVRRGLGGLRTGHTGTLDPFATGLLILCLGWATRLAEYLIGLPKRYRATMRLGIRTDTDDRTGRVLKRDGAWALLEPLAIGEALRARSAVRAQRVPAYSARRRGGTRLYEAARRGGRVEAPVTRMRIDRLEAVHVEGPDVTFDLECSAGTYVRALARDVGEDLGVGAHLTELRRLEVGAFRVEDALPADGLADPHRVAEALRPPEDAVAHLPWVEVAGPDARRLAEGRSVPVSGGSVEAAPVAVVQRGRLIATGVAAGGVLRAEKVFPPAVG